MIESCSFRMSNQSLEILTSLSLPFDFSINEYSWAIIYSGQQNSWWESSKTLQNILLQTPDSSMEAQAYAEGSAQMR